MRISVFIVTVALLSFATVSANPTTAEPTSPAAIAAIQRAEKAIADAKAAYDAAILRARRAEMSALKEAMATAKRAGKTDEATAIADKIQSVQDDIDGKAKTVASDVPGAFKPKSTFTDRCRRVLAASHDPRTRAKEASAKAAEMDAFLHDYLAHNLVSDEMAAAIWIGKPKIGMPIEVVKHIGNFVVKHESTHGLSGDFYIERFFDYLPVGLPGVTLVDYTVSATDGVVTSITDNYPEQHQLPEN